MNDQLNIQLTEDRQSELKQDLNPKDPSDPPSKKKHKTHKKKPEENKDKKKKKKKENENEVKALMSVDPYSMFKQLAPLIPLIPSLYQMVRSLLSDKSTDTHATIFKILDVTENLNIGLYSIFSAALYILFKKSKYVKEKLRTRIKWAQAIRKGNNIFMIWVILVSVVKFTLGCFLPREGDTPEDTNSQIFIFNLISQFGLIVAELFYLYSVFIKKFYKFEQELEEIASWGIEDPENHQKNVKSRKWRSWLHWKKKKEEAAAAAAEESIEVVNHQAKEEEKKEDDKEAGKKAKEEEAESSSESEDEDLEEIKESLEANNKLSQTVLNQLKRLESGPVVFPNEMGSQSGVMIQYLKAISKGSELEILEARKNEVFVIETKLNDTVADVKLRIKDKLGVFMKKNLVVMVGQMELKDENLLIEYEAQLSMYQPILTYDD